MIQGGTTSTSAAAICNDSSILWSGFGRVTIEYCTREANAVPHELVRSASILKFFMYLGRGTLSFTVSRNRLSPRFINKASTAEPIQSGEKNLFIKQNKEKIKKRTQKAKLATEDIDTET
jgi:hypothetical protein